MSMPFRYLRVWLNAFIPANVPGYTDELTSGPHAGRTVIYGLGGSSEAYLTDQRMFTAATDVASQLHSEATVELMASPFKLKQRHVADFATPLGTDGEPAVATGETDISSMKISLATPRSLSSIRDVARAIGTLPLRPDASQDLIFLHFAGTVTPPCAAMAQTFGDIHYEGVFTFDKANLTGEFSGKMHRFPAFEMYAALDNSPAIPIFTLSPPRGVQALHRQGPFSRTVKASQPLVAESLR